MNASKDKMTSKLVVRPGKNYIIVALLLFAIVFILHCVMIYLSLTRADDAVEMVLVSLASFVLYSLPSVILILFCKSTRLTFDKDGVTVAKLLRNIGSDTGKGIW